jgi:hypothetical protein
MSRTLVTLQGSDQLFDRGFALIKALQGAAADEIVRDQTAAFE